MIIRNRIEITKIELLALAIQQKKQLKINNDLKYQYFEIQVLIFALRMQSKGNSKEDDLFHVAQPVKLATQRVAGYATCSRRLLYLNKFKFKQ